MVSLRSQSPMRVESAISGPSKGSSKFQSIPFWQQSCSLSGMPPTIKRPRAGLFLSGMGVIVLRRLDIRLAAVGRVVLVGLMFTRVFGDGPVRPIGRCAPKVIVAVQGVVKVLHLRP